MDEEVKNEQENVAEPTGTSQEGNLKAALTYALGWLTGLIFLLTEKEDEFIRFNAAQSLTVFGGLTIFSFIPFIGQLLGLILWPLSFILWVYLMIKAYKNERVELPVVTDIVKKVQGSVK